MRLIVNILQSSSYSCDNPLSTHICDSVITDEEVTIHLKKLKCHKAARIDGIPAEFYKYAMRNKLHLSVPCLTTYLIEVNILLSGQKD